MRRAALLIILALLVAGCTAPSPPDRSDDGDGSSLLTPSDGLSLSTTFSTTDLVQGESLTVDIVAENTGQADASITGMRTFGASTFVEACSMQPAVSDSNPVTLAGVLPEAEQAGGQARFTLTCDSPDPGLGSGQSDTFRLGTEMTYGYATTARAATTVLPRTETSGGSAVSTDNTAGPVHATIHLDSPTPVDASGGTVSVPIDVENVGGGEVVGAVEVSVSAPGSSASPSGCSRSAELFEGSRSISCDVDVPGSAVTSAGTQVLLEVELDYTYRERLEETITVRN